VFDNLRNCGLLPATAEKLGELRGGDRKSEGEE
jgi:hypothetical protein